MNGDQWNLVLPILLIISNSISWTEKERWYVREEERLSKSPMTQNFGIFNLLHRWQLLATFSIAWSVFLYYVVESVAICGQIIAGVHFYRLKIQVWGTWFFIQTFQKEYLPEQCVRGDRRQTMQSREIICSPFHVLESPLLILGTSNKTLLEFLVWTDLDKSILF